jgi:transcriptional regulator with XRE-family HTH domain
MGSPAPDTVARRYRQARNLTQRQVASALGVSASAVAQWESGADVPRRANALRLDEVLDAAGAVAAAFGYTADDAATEPDRLELLRRLDALDARVAELTELIKTLAASDRGRARRTRS